MNDVEMVKLLDSVQDEVYQGINEVLDKVLIANDVNVQGAMEKRVLVTVAITTALQRHFNVGVKILGILAGKTDISNSTIDVCQLALRELVPCAFTNEAKMEKFEQN